MIGSSFLCEFYKATEENHPPATSTAIYFLHMEFSLQFWIFLMDALTEKCSKNPFGPVSNGHRSLHQSLGQHNSGISTSGGSVFHIQTPGTYWRAWRFVVSSEASMVGMDRTRRAFCTARSAGVPWHSVCRSLIYLPTNTLASAPLLPCVCASRMQCRVSGQTFLLKIVYHLQLVNCLLRFRLGEGAFS